MMGLAGAGVAASVAATAVSAGTAIAGAGKQSGAVSGAAQQANALSQETIQEGRDNYDRDRLAYQPYTSAGTAGLNTFADILGVSGADAAAKARETFQASPGYAYQVEQGLKAVDAGAAARGMLRSGATIKAEQKLGSDLANQDFGNYLGRLNTLAGFGLQGAQGAANSTSTFNNLLTGQSSGQQQTLTSAAGQEASIYGDAAKGVGNAAQGFIKNSLYDVGLNSTTPALGGNVYNGAGWAGTDPTVGFWGG